ncbi:MAG: hypothetical protein M1831_006738 [Alyxoria varia]|nr:MAG: hypothetical protein M1831_006738 [Alyxoria varia]
MMLPSTLLSLAWAHLSHAAQPSSPKPINAPLRNLQWGQINFIHTTDTHGWHGGHLQEYLTPKFMRYKLHANGKTRPSYSADWGDYISFTTHMRSLAKAEGVDLLLIDTGDRIEGNGLYDASDPKGKYTIPIFTQQQDLDIICSGNHELYKRHSAANEFFETVPAYREKYLASNLDFRDPRTGELKPLAQRYRQFTTPNLGIKITAFGFLYNFYGGAKNTVVTPVQDAVKSQWFQDAIRDRSTDLFVVAGHVTADSEEYQVIWKAIREVCWDTPIQFFAGHSHIRDYKKYDARATAIESGRYLETIGFTSIEDLPSVGGGKERSNKDPTFRRKYIDNNLFSLRHHSMRNELTFSTQRGLNVSAQIAAARKELDLDHRYGCAPRDLWVNRVPITSNSSLYKWLGEEVIPNAISEERKKNHTVPFIASGKDPKILPKIVLTNTGALRFDIFQGPFTKDTTYLVSPFTSGFRYLVNPIPYAIARNLLNVLNNEADMLAHLQKDRSRIGQNGVFVDTSKTETLDPKSLPPSVQLAQDRLQARKVQMERHWELRRRRESSGSVQVPLQESSNERADIDSPALSEEVVDAKLTPGYTTTDDHGTDGDDTLHSAIPFFRVSNCIESLVDFPNEFASASFGSKAGSNAAHEPKEVLVVYNAFIQNYILAAYEFLTGEALSGVRDTEIWTIDNHDKTLTEVISKWVQENWQKDGDCEA